MVIFVKNAGGRNLWVYDRTNDGTRTKTFVNDFFPYFYDNNKKKVILTHPGETVEARKQYPITYEADIPYVKRYLLDRVNTPIQKKPLKICYLDIEVERGNGSLDTKNTPMPVTMVGLLIDNSFTQFVGDENEIFNSLNLYIANQQPDIITGWNVENYDFEYLKNRAVAIGAKRIPNTFVQFDLLTFYKKMTIRKLESYSLENVSQIELGEGKAYDKSEEEYNKQDVLLVEKLDKKLGIIEYYDELRRIIGCEFDDLKYNSTMIDMLVLKESKEPLPTRVKKKKEKFDGAYVIAPEKGIHKNIACLDFKSLYPSIICQFNISTDSKSKNGDIKLPNGVCYDSTINSFTKQIVEKLWNKRKYYKSKEHYDFNKQYSYKVLVNAFYGYFGYPGSRLYDIGVVASIPLMGQKAIHWTADLLKDYKYNIIAGDTDSVYVEVKDKEDAKKITKLVNDSLDEFVQQYGCKNNNFMEIEFEELYDKILFFNVKKKYICLSKGKMKYVGAEIIRRDKTQLTKQFQKTVFENVLKKDWSYKQVEELAISYKYKLHELPLEDITIPASIGKSLSEYKRDSFAVLALKNGVKYLSESMSSNKIRVLYVKKYCKYIGVDIKNAHKLKDLPINTEKMHDLIFGNTLKLLKAVMVEESNLKKWMVCENDNTMCRCNRISKTN